MSFILGLPPAFAALPQPRIEVPAPAKTLSWVAPLALAYQDLAGGLEGSPPPQAGELLRRGRRLLALAPQAALWLSSNLEKPLEWMSPDAVPEPRLLGKAREALPGLRALLGLEGLGRDAAARASSHPELGPASQRIARRLAGLSHGSTAGAVPVSRTVVADRALSRGNAASDAMGAASSSAEADGPDRAQAETASERTASKSGTDPVTGDDAIAVGLRRIREDLDGQEKLGQRHDLARPEEREAEIKRLEALMRRYEELLAGPESKTPGPGQSQELRRAWLKHLRELFETILEPAQDSLGPRPELAGTTEEAEIEALVSGIEALKAELQGRLAGREALAGMLAAAERLRQAALRERRSGREMLEFRKNFARLAMVMDLSYSLNLLNSAEKALAGMQDLLDKKIGKIDAQRKANEERLKAASAQKARREEWRREAQGKAAEDETRAEDFAALARKSDLIARRVAEFRAEVGSLLSAIDARDKGSAGSPDALTEYGRRLLELPRVQRALIGADSDSATEVRSLSLSLLKKKSSEIVANLRDLAEADARMATAALETAGVLVWAVPGIPRRAGHNPQTGEIVAMLAERRRHFAALEKEQAETLASIRRSLDPANSRRLPNDFGDPVPESLAVYRQEQEELQRRLEGEAGSLAAAMDSLAAAVEGGASGGAVPRLSGRSASELRDRLPSYADRLDELAFPDTEAGFSAKMDKLALARRLPAMGDLTVRRLEAEATVKALEKPLQSVLPEAQRRFDTAVKAVNHVLSDVGKDEAYVASGYPRAQAQDLIDRKRGLLSSADAEQPGLKTMLAPLQVFLDATLIPYQQERIDLADPQASGESLAVLYEEKAKLYTRIQDALHKTLPWGLASNGAKAGDAAGARANIQALRQDFEEYRRIIADLNDQLRRRKDPKNPETEDVYGEPAPYSLVLRQAKYQEEKALRAEQFNARVAQVKDLLARMDALAPGRSLLVRFGPKLPAGISAQSPESVARLRAMAENRVLQDMAAEIKAIAEEASRAGSGGLEVGGSSGGGIPSGTQPPVDLPPRQKLALLGLEAVKRLVPTTASPGSALAPGDSLAEAMARFLFADALVETSRKNLEERIPLFERFLAKAGAVLDLVFADLDLDLAYVSSDLSGGTAVLDRKLAVYARIRDTAGEGAELFKRKAFWSAEGLETAEEASGYYDSLTEVYDSGNQALDAEREAARKFKETLSAAQEKLRQQKATVSGWLKSLNDPRESALNRVAQNLSQIQDKTLAVLETNIEHHRLKAQYDEAQRGLSRLLEALSREQERLSRALEEVGDLRRLSPRLAGRLRAAAGPGGSWLAASREGPAAIVVPKSRFASFLAQLFGALSADSASRDILALREDILKNPMALAQLLPSARMIEVGEGASGFYLVYQTELSTPFGLETASQMTLGNALNLWGHNVSVIGHRFASPPSEVNPPFGDQGLTFQIESLQGANWVNYLNVTFHKFIQDIPADLSVASQARESRLMVFDDFALMLANGKLYFGAAGFADFALDRAAEKPYYYGANLKARVRFTEVMSLSAEESLLLAKDPRRFLQTVNLDFTKYDPDLDKDFVIAAKGEKKFFRRDKIGAGFDLQKLLETKDSFTMELYFARVSGTDDHDQSAVGASVLKGFSFEVAESPVNVSVGGSGELGQKYHAASARLSFELPKQGLVLNAQGKLLGDAQTYWVELKKKLGPNSEAFVSYGSRYVGLNHRLAVGAQTTFTLGELWRLVAAGAAENLRGGQALERFNLGLKDFFERETPQESLLQELKRAFDADVGRRLLSLEIGELSKEIAELQRAGAILDNVRIRGMVGFVTNPVGGGTAERATGGGFQVGTQSELTLTKTQKSLAGNKTRQLFAAGLRLQERLLETAKAWQAVLVELVESRWDLLLALWVEANADEPRLKAEARVRALEAAGRLRQAGLRYNALTGRGPDEALGLLETLNTQDLDAFLRLLEKALADPQRLSKLVGGLGPGIQVPESSFNIVDWIPFVERLTFYIGVQLQDILANQVIGAGVSIRIPVYDPASKHADKALLLEDEAMIREMAAAYRALRLRSRQERDLARSWESRAAYFASSAPAVRKDLHEGLRGWRNGLVPAAELLPRVRRWHWSMRSHLEARAQAALQGAWAVLDEGPQPGERTAGVGGPALAGPGLDASKGSLDWEALALRSQAAQELFAAASHRVSKVSVDVNLGVNITAAGIAWIPAFGITGLGVFPIINIELKPEELKALEMERRGAQARLYSRLKDKVSSDLALQLFEARAAHRAALAAAAVYERELIPALEARAGRGSREAWELDRARMELEALRSHAQSLRAVINHLVGQPLDTAVALEDMETALRGIAVRFAQERPLEANRDVLESRLRVARAVEERVDKNLQVQNIRLEPASLVGRALGRLIAALSGEGLASPELAALARHQTLEAERELQGFERGVESRRGLLAFELSRARRRHEYLKGSREPRERIEAAALEGLILRLKAQLAALGSSQTELPAAALPASPAELREKLEAAFAQEAAGLRDGGRARFLAQELPFEARGNLRFYDLRRSLSNEPIGRRFAEGWVEVRLRSAATPPEALVALARLQEESADQARGAELAAAKARAALLLSRLRLDAALLSSAGPGPLAVRARERLERDVAELAARLGLGAEAGFEDIRPLLELEQGGSLDSAFARHKEAPATSRGFSGVVFDYLEEARSLDLELLRLLLFPDGLPQGWAGADAALRLQAGLIAERMSSKGFTPVAAFGIFQGRWVGGVFLEAPDPAKIQKSLEGILNEALRRELESQDRLQSLSLMLHSLMASVSDKIRSAQAQAERLETARRGLLAAAQRLPWDDLGGTELAVAQEEVLAAQAELLETLYALRLDFVRLTSELEALGYEPGPDPAYQALPPKTPAMLRGSPLVQRPPQEELLRYWSRRMLDRGFESRQEALLSGVPEALRRALAEDALVYRVSRRNQDAVLHKDFTAAETFELLLKVDLEGRRKKLEATLGRILQELSSQDPGRPGGWTGLMEFLRADVEVQERSASQALFQGQAMRRGLREAFWRAHAAPPPVEAAFSRLSALSDQADQARQEALRLYLAHEARPEDYVRKDAALEAYVKALIAYDEEMLGAFSSPELGGDPRWGRALDSLFGLRRSFERRKAHLRYGRGILTLEAAIELSEARVGALRWDSSGPLELEPALAALGFLRQMRERWIRNPRNLEALYEVKGGEPLWITGRDLEALKARGLVLEFGARRFLLEPSYVGVKPRSPAEALKAGAREIVGGLDAQEDALAKARDRARERGERLQVAETLQGAEAAVVENGKAESLSLAELRRLEAEGRVRYFNAKPDPRTGLRLAVHPLAARWRSPEELVIVVLPAGSPPDAFASLEALEASAKTGHGKVELGEKGLEAMKREAEEEELSARRRGWLLLKLEAYAFALDAEGEVAEVFMSEEEISEASQRGAKAGAESGGRVHRTADLRLGLDSEGLLAAVEGKGLSRRLGAGVPLRWIEGDIWALEVDGQGRVERLILSEEELEYQAASWWIEDMEGRLWRQTDKGISPVHRLKRYIDPRTGLPVLLGRGVLARRLAKARRELGRVGTWAYRPGNWPNILLETPRGILKTPIELLTGRDPNQEGYIGRVYMYQTDGGSTRRHGALGEIVRFLDIFELLSDPVERYMDPSQFPKLVDNDSPLLPGQWEHEKSPRTQDGRKNVHFGKGSLLRFVSYAQEDLEDARGRILSNFDGGVRRLFVETVRGRDGSYAQASLDHKAGRLAVEEALRRLGSRAGAEGKAVVSASPEHVAVDKVLLQIEVALGARQQAARVKLYEEALGKLRERGPVPEPEDGALLAAASELAKSLELRRILREALEAAKPRADFPAFPALPLLFVRLSGSGRYAGPPRSV